jgi:TolB-like protein/TolA-binding protein
MSANPEPASGKRLDSWKEIAAFFGRTDRTVKRWENERGLPVHRVPGGGRSAVFAYTTELADWLKGKDQELEADEPSSVAIAETSSGSVEVIQNAHPPAENAGRVGQPASASQPATERATALPISPLRWALIFLVVLAVTAVVVFMPWPRRKPKLVDAANSVQIHSVAVLPLQNLSNDPNQEYFADGMTDELITDLAKLRELRVVSKTSVMQYKGTRRTLPQIGQELGVDAVVEGSVLRSGDRVRITAQLIRASTDRHIWANTYDGDLKDVLALQARVAEAITNEVKLNLSAGGSERLFGASTASRDVNPEAYDLYLRGRYAWKERTEPSFQAAIAYFNQAVEKDPSFAPAYAGLADCHTLLVLYNHPGDVAAAYAYGEKALQLDDTLAEAHTSLAAVKIIKDSDWEGAEREFQRAIELNPNYAQAHHWYGNLLLDPQGRHEEALAELRRAQELDPLSPAISTDIGYSYYLAGRNDLAEGVLLKVLAANPDFQPAHFYLQDVYLHTKRYDLWIRQKEEMDRAMGHPEWVPGDVQRYEQGGYRAVLESVLAAAQPADDTHLRCRAAAPGPDVALGRNAAALDAMEDCYRRGGTTILYLKVDPQWANLRSDPRFQNLLRRMRLQ